MLLSWIDAGLARSHLLSDATRERVMATVWKWAVGLWLVTFMLFGCTVQPGTEPRPISLVDACNYANITMAGVQARRDAGKIPDSRWNIEQPVMARISDTCAHPEQVADPAAAAQKVFADAVTIAVALAP